MLYFDDATVGGIPSPTGPEGNVNFFYSKDAEGRSAGSPMFTYHGLTFSTGADMAFALVDQAYMYGNASDHISNTGYVSSPANNLVTDASTSALSALTISTGRNGAIKVISLFVSQPDISGQSITITGSLDGASSPGCSGTFTPTDGAGTAVQFSSCVADTLVLTGNTAIQGFAEFLVGIDSLMACSATATSALTASP